MIDNEKHIQDWTIEEKTALLSFVQENCGVDEPVDICAAGSRVYWHDFAKSDIDVVVFMPDEGFEKPPNIFIIYDETRLTISFQPISLRNAPFSGYQLSLYSLMTETMYSGIVEEEVAFKAKYG